MAKKKAAKKAAKKKTTKKASKKELSKEEGDAAVEKQRLADYCKAKGSEFLKDQFYSQKTKKDAGKDYSKEYHAALETELKRRS